ncbi:MAG TPA: tripartite tricarboxylate transporter substrate binding protein [Burkholderiaceae bacterium]|jgi:tripartite-type tricarboxylate transporter receptor subunit TctC
MRRRELLLAAAAAPVGAGAAPSDVIRLLVAYPPGGVSDASARLLASLLSEHLHRPVIVENHAGAGGVVAIQALARAVPDGKTLCFAAISPLLHGPWVHDAHVELLRQVQPLVAVMETPVLLLATPSFHVRSLADVLAAARADPGSVRWGNSGLGTTGHRVMEALGRAAGVQFTDVPYKGGGRQLNDALSGQFEILSSNVASLQLAYVQQGRLTAIAVGGSHRVSALPAVPTLAELGFPQANLVSTFGIFAPRGLPEPQLRRLNAAVQEVMAQPPWQRWLALNSNLPAGGSPEDFARRIEQERSSAVAQP